MHKPETYDAGFSHQIGRYSDAIRVPAGQGHDQIIVSGTPGLDENGAPSRPISLTRRARRGRTSERSWLRQAPRSATSSAAAST